MLGKQAKTVSPATLRQMLAYLRIAEETARAIAQEAEYLAGSREEITVGDMVLVADDEPGDGWYEAIITEEVSADTFKLIYRDYPEHPYLVGRRKDFGLLPTAK